MGERGLVFFNAKDKCWQAVPGDGKGVIIINQVAAEKAAALLEKIYGCLRIRQELSLEDLKALIQFACEELKLSDMYNTSRDFVAKKMSVVSDEFFCSEAACGLMKRNDRDICQAVFVGGRFAFEGTSSTPQIFEEGGVLVKVGNECYGVQPEIFERTYRHASGQLIECAAKEVRNQEPVVVQ